MYFILSFFSYLKKINMYIEKVEIENIRSISHFEMTFPNPAGWHVIIGDNGSGKTSVLKVISIALLSLGEALEELDSLIKQGVQEAITTIIFDDNSFSKLTINNDTQNNTTAKLEKSPIHDTYPLFSTGYGSLRITHEEVEFPDIKPSPKSSLAYSTLLGGETGLRVAYFWLRELYIQKIDIDNNSAQEREIASQLLDKIKILVNNGNLLPNGIKLEKIDSKGIWFVDEKGTRLHVDSLSDGFRSILNITIDIIYRMVGYYGEQKVIDSFGEVCNLSGIILIDEIDAHLHPTWQTRIGQWFTTYFPNIQFIVTTHSPLVCRACEKGSIWRLTAPGSNTESGEITGLERERLIYGNILDAYGTEVFGASAVRSEKSNEKLKRLGKLDMLAAFGKITEKEEKERLELLKIFQTDVTIN
jgi:predicted ATPase